MKARIFAPTSSTDYASDGTDYDFEAVPEVGQTIRFSDAPDKDHLVTKVVYIQEHNRFVLGIYTKPAEDADVAAG